MGNLKQALEDEYEREWMERYHGLEFAYMNDYSEWDTGADDPDDEPYEPVCMGYEMWTYEGDELVMSHPDSDWPIGQYSYCPF